MTARYEGPRDPDARQAARHQPASTRDLERFPPADAACAAVRGMLRDYADRDLEPADVRRVDEHVHTCRDCGLALSRVELESLRLGRAFEAEARSVREHAESLETLSGRIRDLVIAGEEDVEPSADFTSSVMARIRDDWRRPDTPVRVDRGSEGGRRRLPSALVAVTALAAAWLVGLSVWGYFFEAEPERGVGPVARVVACQGDVSVVDSDGRTVGPARIGQELSPSSMVRTGVDGSAVLDVEGVGAPARIELDARGRVGLTEVADACALSWLAGSGRISVGEMLGVDSTLRVEGLADGRVDLDGGGVYDLNVADRLRFDGVRVATVRLEVLEGRALVARGPDARETATVDSAKVAHFGDLLPLVVEAGMSPDLLAFARRTQLAMADEVERPADAPSRWVGRVVDDRTGVGVAGAAVALDLQGRRVERVTDARGEFDLPTSVGDLCVVTVRPPLDSSLAEAAPRPVVLPAEDGGRLETLRLVAEDRHEGTVVDAAGQPLVAARVVPCVLDEVFGRCDVRDDLSVTTDVGGRFTLRGLPSGLEPSQTLAFLVHHDAAPTGIHRAEAGGDTVEGGGLEHAVRTPPARDVELSGLPAGQSIELVQEVPGVPMRAFVVRHRVDVDATGRAALSGIGPGRVFQVDPADGSRGFALTTSEAEPGVLSVAAAGAVDLGVPVTSVASVAAGVEWGARQGTRFAMLAERSANPTARMFALDADANVSIGTRLYLLGADGSVEYLGEFSGDPIPFSADGRGEFTVVAIAPDGSLGWRSSARFEGRATETVQMRRPGAVVFDGASLGVGTEAAVDGAVAPSALLRFRLVDGPLAGTEFWRVVRVEGEPRVDGLVPGRYEVEFDNGGRIEVKIEPGGDVRVGDVLDQGR